MHVLRAEANVSACQQSRDSDKGRERRAEDFFHAANFAQLDRHFKDQVTGFRDGLVHFPVSSNEWCAHDLP